MMTEHGTERSRRRAFFREAAGRLVRPLADYIESRYAGARDDTSDRRGSRPERPLRPPGAVAESEFGQTCARCGACVQACPADAIVPLENGPPEGWGTPVIAPSRAACVVCDGIQCTKVCPSGALLPLYDPRDIRMGLAKVDEPVCLRSQGETCTVCVDRCPFGEAAIRFPNDGPPEVLAEGCVGCGVCEFYCPTLPKAIVVEPTAGAAREGRLDGR